MARNYTVSTRIARPVAEVYDAIVSGDRLTKYFVNRTSGDLVEGARIAWHWDLYGDNHVVVKTLEKNRRIVLALDSRDWQKTADEAYAVQVVFELEALDDGGTALSISEEGWKTDAPGLKASHENCGGWMHMAMCLKAFVEHGIDLR